MRYAIGAIAVRCDQIEWVHELVSRIHDDSSRKLL
jgi:hypothetical protein